MAVASNNEFPSVLIKEGTAPASPAAGDQRVYIDSADHKFKRKDSSGTITTIEGGGGGTLTSASSYLSSDVTLTSANTFYDGPSLSLAAGTWLITSAAVLYNGSASDCHFTAKIWDGTTASSSNGLTETDGSHIVNLVLGALVSPSITTTYKISVAATQTGGLIKAAALSNPAGNTASYIIAVKIA